MAGGVARTSGEGLGLLRRRARIFGVTAVGFSVVGFSVVGFSIVWPAVVQPAIGRLRSGPFVAGPFVARSFVAGAFISRSHARPRASVRARWVAVLAGGLLPGLHRLHRVFWPGVARRLGPGGEGGLGLAGGDVQMPGSSVSLAAPRLRPLPTMMTSPVGSSRIQE